LIALLLVAFGSLAVAGTRFMREEDA
jgi:hypothetical protein